MKNKGIIVLIIVVGIISIAALGFSVYNFISTSKSTNSDNLIVGKWKNEQSVAIPDEKFPKTYEVIYEFKKDGTCKINDYDCTYKNGLIAVNDEIFGEYYINIYNNNKLYISVGLEAVMNNLNPIGGHILEKIN